MSAEVLTIALMAGLANWAFRFLPTRFDLSAQRPDGLVARFLAATGPAAICTLFVASLLPSVQALPTDTAPLLAGLVAVGVIFAGSRSVAGATFAGAAAYALMFWVLE